MKLFHVSDVHFGREDPAAIAWFTRAVADERPDAVIMTGDLTMRARPREFQAGGDWLASLGVPVTVEIGNHDVPHYWDLARRFVAPYRRYLKIERMIERPLDLPGVTVVPLRTVVRWQWRRLNQSKGQVSGSSLREALRLIGAAPAGDTILVAAHHPLIEGPTRGTARTTGGARALAALCDAGAHAVLSGHVHDPYDIPYERGGRTMRLIGAGTLSVRVRQTPPGFNELTLAGGRLEVLARSFSPEPDRLVASGRAVMRG